MYSAPEVIC